MLTCALITHPYCLLHDTGLGHPECKERLEVIGQALIRYGLDSQLRLEEAPMASFEQLSLIHEKKYIEALIAKSPEEGLIKLDPDTVMSPDTLTAARYAAGAVIKAVDLILSNEVTMAFCKVRPPGHHAEKNRAMGFCFFNNIALGVAHALTHYKLSRVAIIDFDVHQGNGTENIFQNNKKVLICSMYEDMLYPNDGTRIQAKNIIDIPLSSGSGSHEFRAEFTQHALDAVKAFKPELIFISAGFDGHQQDPISHVHLTELDYFWISQQIKQLADTCCKGRIVSVLEGGYALGVLGECVVAHIRGLRGD